MTVHKRKHKKSVLNAISICLCICILLLTFAAGFITGRSSMSRTSSNSSDESVSQTPDTQPVIPDSPQISDESSTEETPSSQTEVSESETSEEAPNEIAKKLASMSLEEKVAQMFMITPEALTGMDTVTAAGDMSRDALNQYPVGGLIYFSKNLDTPEQVQTMLENIQQFSLDRIGLPLFLNVDEEGGTVTRFGHNSNFSLGEIGNMRSVGDSKNTQNAYDTGVRIGSFLYKLGFNMDNAPVADVLSNAANTVIGSRSFGSDCKIVSDMALAELAGLNSQQIIGVYKHFPGHGATEADTHEGYAYTNASLDEMMQNDLIPFINGINSGVQVIMAAHIACPEVTGDDTPASLSSVMITDILRNKLGYNGIVMTDGLNMGAITAQYNSAQAAVAAVNAGADLLLMPADFHAAYNGILEAVQNGTISEDRINTSVERILTLKKEQAH